jgi:hypothetical protein
MPTEQGTQDLFDRVAGLREQLVRRLGADLIANPQLSEALVRQVDDLLHAALAAQAAEPPPPDLGVAQLAGIGPGAADDLGETRLPPGVVPYDETVVSERIVAVGDLYYLYQHERLGVFRAVRKLQELFRAGTVRLSDGPGAFGLYQFDRRDVLRYTRQDRHAAYARILGYGSTAVPRGARRNAEFHGLFTHFINQTALFWRDKRISDVIRERANDPSFGSIAVVRRAGLDLRNNLKFASFGHLNVLRVELMQVLDEAFRVLEADDIKRLFGADNAWDVLEEVLLRYFGERLVTSPRQRMGVAGREVLRWLGQPHVLQTARSQFEALLLQIAEYAEEWLTSAESLGAAERRSTARVMPFQGRAPLAVIPAAGSPR